MSSKLFSALILLFLLVACQSSAWRKAKEQNTVSSYEFFLKKYPDGTYSDEARDALQFLEWDETGKKGSEQAFQKFIEKYPKSEFLGVAQRLKEEAALKAAEKENTSEAYQEFIRKNPKSRLQEKAQKEMTALSWEAARKENSLAGYQEFLKKNKESLFRTEAEKMLENLQQEKYEVALFKQAEKENTLAYYRAFLEIYPRGVYAQKAISLLLPLLPETMKERVKDLLSQDPLTRARAVLTLHEFDSDKLLLISTLLINMLDDATPIHPEGRVWQKSSTIAEETKKLFLSMGNKAVPPLQFALFLGGYLNSRYSDEVRIRILETLAKIGDRDTLLQLIDFLKLKEISLKVKLETIKVLLVDFQEPDAESILADLLTDFLHHEDRDIRWETVQKLREIDHPTIIGPLVLSLDDNDSEVQMEKIKLLGIRRAKLAVQPLITILESGDKQGPRNCAAESLTIIGDRSAMKPFLSVLKSKANLTLRRKAMKGLVAMYDFPNDTDITDELVHFSNDPDQFIQFNARDALTRAGVTLPPEK